eukprot:gene13416-19269_t
MDSNKPGYDSTTRAHVLNYVDFVILGLFTVEMILKMIGLGLSMEQGSYFRSGWNCMDFFIVITGYLAFGPLGNYTALRALRVFRPLRTVTKLEEMRVIVGTFLGSISLLGSVLCLVGFYFIVFGIACLSLFSGTLNRRCAEPDFSGAYIMYNNDGAAILGNVTYPNPVDLNDRPSTMQEMVCKGPISDDIVWMNNSAAMGSIEGQNGVLLGPEGTGIHALPFGHGCAFEDGSDFGAYPYGVFCAPYINPGIKGWQSFDNILLSFLAIFQHVTMADYIFVMYDLQNGINWWIWPLNLIMVVLGAYILASLVLAVLFLYFSRQAEGAREEHINDEPLAQTASEDFTTSPFDSKQDLWNRFRQRVFTFQNSKYFNIFSISVIVLNGIVLGLIWYKMPYSLAQATKYMNWAFTLYFVVEIIIRLLGQGLKMFFSSSMNIFDGVVTLACLIDLIISAAPGLTSEVSGALTALRLLRLFRLARFWRSLYLVIVTVVRSFKSVLYLSLLLLLIMFITGLLGMNLFGYNAVYCNLVLGSEQLCPPGLTYDECPRHYDCYVDCDLSLAGSWYNVSGSPYGGMAYCEAFPRQPSDGSSLPAGTEYSYYAQVGKAMVTIFQLLTLDNWPTVCHLYMSAISPWSALFFTVIIVITYFIMLSLFLAILLDNLEHLSSELDQKNNKEGDKNPEGLYPLPQAPDRPADGKLSAAVHPLPQALDRQVDVKLSATEDSEPQATARGNITSLGDDDSVEGFRAGATAIVRSSNGSRSNKVRPLPPPSSTNLLLQPPPLSSSSPAVQERQRSLTPEAEGPHTSASNSPPVLPDHSPSPFSPAEVGGNISISSTATDGSNSGAHRDHSHRGVKVARFAVPDTEDAGSEISDIMGRAESADRPTPVSSEKYKTLTEVLNMRSYVEDTLSGLPDLYGGSGNSRKTRLSSAHMIRPRSFSLGAGRRQSDGGIGENRMVGVSLGIFGPFNRIREACQTVSENRWFQRSMILLIIASCVGLALDVDGDDRGSQLGFVLLIMDIMFCAAFLFEAAIKIIFLGFAFNGPQSYIRQRWNMLDLFVALLSLVVLVMEFALDEQYIWLNALRSLRGLRLLRAASLHNGIRVVVAASMTMLPAISNVLMVGALFYYMFAVLAVNLLAGKQFYCGGETGQVGGGFNGGFLDAYYFLPQGETINKTWCEANDGEQNITTSYYHSALGVAVPAWNEVTSWGADRFRFDNVFNAMWTLFSMASLEGWSDVMYQTAAAVGEEQNLIMFHQVWMELLSIAFIIIGSFLMLNLLAGVAIDVFKKMKMRSGGGHVLLTDDQNEWLTTQKMMVSSTLRQNHVCPTNPLRKAAFSIIYCPFAEWAILGVIMVNVFSLMLYFNGQNKEWHLSLSILNIVFTGIFTVEMLLKWIAVGLPSYFRCGWNIFDFIVVVLAWVGIILSLLGYQGSSALSIFRALRVIRMFRLVPKMRRLRMMVQAILWSLPAVGNLSAVLFVYMFIYAIFGMQFFGNIGASPNWEAITQNCNFHSFSSTMLLLFRCMTGENWNALMVDAMNRNDCILVTVDQTVTLEDGTTEMYAAGTYLDPGSDAYVISEMSGNEYKDMCSIAPWVSILYFCSYMLVVSFLVLQLVIGLLLESMGLISYLEEVTIGQTLIYQFKDAWEVLDPTASGFIPTKSLSILLMRVKPPLGVKGVANQRLAIHQLLSNVDIPNREGNRAHFLEALHALAGRLVGVALPMQEEVVIHNKLISKLPTDDVPKYTAANYHDALTIADVIRRIVQRRDLKWQVITKSFTTMATAARDRRQAVLRGDLAPAVDVAPPVLDTMPAAHDIVPPVYDTGGRTPDSVSCSVLPADDALPPSHDMGHSRSSAMGEGRQGSFMGHDRDSSPGEGRGGNKASEGLQDHFMGHDRDSSPGEGQPGSTSSKRLQGSFMGHGRGSTPGEGRQETSVALLENTGAQLRGDPELPLPSPSMSQGAGSSPARSPFCSTTMLNSLERPQSATTPSVSPWPSGDSAVEDSAREASSSREGSSCYASGP